MSLDSLTNELDEQFDWEYGRSNDAPQLGLPIRVLKTSRESIAKAKQVLAHDGSRLIDYQGFIKFLGSCSMPTVPTSDVEKKAFVRNGWTMTVFEGVWKTSEKSQVVAVKQLNLELALGKTSEEEHTNDFRLKVASIVLEIRMLSHELLKSHRNIVRLLGITWHAERCSENGKAKVTPALLVEFAACKDGKPLTLETYINQMKNQESSLKVKIKLLSDIASGLVALQALGVVHGDVKPENILLFQEDALFVAKISDFGFCIAGDEDLKTAKGGTPYWNAPECIAEASDELHRYRAESMRDYFSYGLIIWFVLFEEEPFHGTAAAFSERKLQNSMKDQIDKAFFARYRLRPLQADSGVNLDNSKCPQQERYHSSQKWLPCSENRQHVLRFLMQWVLVRSPLARQSTFDLYRRLLDDESSFQLAGRTFETPDAWDAEWAEFGIPSNRLQKNLKIERLQLREFENASLSKRIHGLQGKTIPFELQQEIFQQSRSIFDKDPKALEHIKIVAECHMAGFGVKEDRQKAFHLYVELAEGGDAESSETLLRIWPVESSKLDGDLYCQILIQVLLASFGTENDELSTVSRSSYTTNIERLRKLLHQNLTLSKTPLERAFQIQALRSRNVLRDGNGSQQIQSSHMWEVAVKAIQDDDQDVLRYAIHENPNLRSDRHAGIGTLAHVFVRYGRAGLLRMLIQDIGVDPSEPDTNGLTPLSLAIKIGSTAAMRVLISINRDAKIQGAQAAMDNASEGHGDITRVLYDNFVNLQQLSSKPWEAQERSDRWSFFSLASAVVNNNWNVFCTLLAIGVDPNTVNPLPTASSTSFFAATLLAATTYNSIMLAAALAFGASTDTRIPCPDGRTALHLACGKYQETASSLDLIHGELFDHWTSSRTETWRLRIGMVIARWPAYSIAESPDLSSAKLLLELDPPANINGANFFGYTALHESIRDGSLVRLEFCLEHGANLEQQTELGETALAIAVKEGNIEICKRLLFAGAKIAARDANGQNCLTLAIQSLELRILDLFEAAALKESKRTLEELILEEDCRGWNALHVCIMKSDVNPAIVSLFERWLNSLEYLNINATDPLGWTLLHIAVASNYTCTDLLLQRGASVNVKDSILGWTPLHHACSEGNEQMWNTLLGYGADLYIKDEMMGWSPLTVMEQAMDCRRLDQNDNFESRRRHRLAKRRKRLREPTAEFFTRQSMGRMIRPIVMADINREVELRRKLVFPEQPVSQESSPPEDSVRKLKTCFWMDNEGTCRFWEAISPSQIQV